MSNEKQNKELTDKQLNDIKEIENLYSKKISSEQKEVSNYEKKIKKLEDEKRKNEKEISKLRRERNRKIIDIKDSERAKRYKNIDIKVGNIYHLECEDVVCTEYEVKFGSYRIWNNHNSFDYSIEIEGETPTQYRLKLKFPSQVQISNPSNWMGLFGRTISELRCNMKKLNFKDFLAEKSSEFKREVKISDIVD